MSKELIIFGYSGHAHVVIDSALLNGFDLTSYVDAQQNTDNLFKLKHLGSEEDLNISDIQNSFVFPSVGSNKIRKKLCGYFLKNSLKQTTIIHPSAIISKHVTIDQSSFINANCTINANTKIGRGAIINTGAIIEHDCTIGAFVHIAPGAVLAGNVEVGDNSFVGAGTIVKQGVKIGNDVIIGAGSLVLKDIFEPGTYFGRPATKMKL